MTGLELDGVTIAYDGGPVIGPVTCRVPSGGWVCLIGPNGAGKSSLLHAVAGTVGHSGAIRVDGAALSALPTRQRARLVSLVTQRPTIPPDMPVADYVLLGRTPHIPYFGMETGRDRAIAAASLDRLDLGPFAARHLGTLSGGELQRVLLARALAQQAPVLLLDEPTSALDLGHQQQVLGLIDELRHEYRLTVLSTMHDLTLAGSHADALILLHLGLAAAEGPPEQVLTESILRQYYDADVEIVRAKDGTLAVIPLAPRSSGIAVVPRDAPRRRLGRPSGIH